MKLLCFTFTVMFLVLDRCPADEDAKSRMIEFNVPEGLGAGFFRDQGTEFTVQWPVGGGKIGEKRSPSAIGSVNLQVWLLKVDGTSIPQVGKPSLISIGSIGNYENDYMVYRFSRVPTNEIAGIVVRVNGTLYCQELGVEKSTAQKKIASADSALLTAKAYLKAEKIDISRHDMSKPELIQEIQIQGHRAWRVSWKLKNFTGKGGQLVVILNEDGTCERGWGE